MKSILDVNVSAYKNYYSKDPKTVNLLKWLTTDKYLDQVLEVRKESDKAKREQLKSNLPVVTVSGIFSGRGSSTLVKHSGLIAIDVDLDHNSDVEDFKNFKQEISQLSEIAYCGLSVSGTGYFCIINISDPDDHVSHFNAIYENFKDFNITIDKSCSDVSRLRGISYDPDAYFNHNASKYERKIVLEEDPIRVNDIDIDLKYEYNKVNKLIKKIEDKRICILSPKSDGKGGYINYFENTLVSLFNTFGEETAYSLFIRLCKVCQETEIHDSSRYYRYGPEEARKVLNRLVEADKNYTPSKYGKKTIASFYRLCKDLNITYSIDWKPYHQTIEYLLDGREDFATYMIEENDLKIENMITVIDQLLPKLNHDEQILLQEYKTNLIN